MASIPPLPSFTVEVAKQHGDLSLRLRGRCGELSETRHLVATVEEVLQRCVSVLWIDCQQVEEVNRCGQGAILQIERLAAAAHIVIYWSGFQSQVIQQLSESGLYLLLRTVPVVNYRSLLA